MPTAYPSAFSTASSASRACASSGAGREGSTRALTQPEQPTEHGVDVLGKERLVEKIRRAFGSRAILDPDIARPRDHHHLSVWLQASQLSQSCKAVDARHLIIEENDVECLLLGSRDRRY